MRKHLIVALAWAWFAAPVFADERADGWRADIELTRTDFLNRDLSYSALARAEADQALRDLSGHVENLSDAEIVAELAQVAALSGNAHTRAYVLRNRGIWRRFPIRIWKFGDEWRVVAARPGHENLLGARLVQVAGTPVARAEARLRPLFAGNDNWAAYMASYSLTSPDAMLGMGVARGEGDVRFVFERDGRRIRARLSPEPFVRREQPEEAWWFLSPAHPATEGWAHVLRGRALPPALAGANTAYRMIRCEGAAYLQINRAGDSGEGETLRAFGERVLAELASDPPRRLIVDLRFNTGGNLQLAWPVFNTLAASPLGQEEGRTIVIVGPNTFSAGIAHAVQMRTLSHARFVGTDPGDVLETWSEGGNVLLPYSRINMHYADEAHTYSTTPSTAPADRVHLDMDVASMAPDIAADWTWESYRNGRDPYLEAALGAQWVCEP